MNIVRVETWAEELPLTRPYEIAFKRVDRVTLHFVRLISSSHWVGLGCAAPTDVTRESSEACAQAMDDMGQDLLRTKDPRQISALTRALRHHMPDTPAARAALDMALYDLVACSLDIPVVDLLGRRHNGLLTSITIGILPLEETLTEAEEYVARGFRVLKVKLGHDIQEDIERLVALRKKFGARVRIRVDANQGYDTTAVLKLVKEARRLDLEFIEQPLPASAVDDMRALPPEYAPLMAADESLHTEQDALGLTHQPPFGIYNIKLMKCGGITSGLAIADLAAWADLHCMWGCMDESVISIAAALHTAYASPATRYLDLDGSLDLSRDVASGGFQIREGRMEVLEEPGLGVRLA